MKSVYACSKLNGTLALAIDIIAIDDPKVIGALLKLAGENSLTVDRVDRADVIFEDPALIQSKREEIKDKRQLEIDFAKGPAEMGEGFTCEYSGECPTPSKSCAGCQYASNGIPKSVMVSPEVAAVVAEPDPEKDERETCPVCNGSGVNGENAAILCAECHGDGKVPKAEAPTLVDEINASPMMQWAKNEAGEDIQVGVELPSGMIAHVSPDVQPETLEALNRVGEILAQGEDLPTEDGEDDSEYGQDEPRSDDAEGAEWEELEGTEEAQEEELF
jgi:hypothetical protein